jgi:hypothetical protein
MSGGIVAKLVARGFMIACEYIFKEFNSLGSDEYLPSWALQVDQLGEEGWEVVECVRRPRNIGLWTVTLCRQNQNAPRRKMRHDFSEDREE